MSKRQGKQQFRVDVRGQLNGRCNICGQDGPLTEDHTPPKSCGGVTAAHVRALRETLEPSERSTRRARPQRRVTVRSLCRRCNSDLLGHLYDPALADFCRQVRTAADSVLQLPNALSVRIRPAAVMRSVVGHMAAQEVDRYLKGTLTEPLRDYILDATLPLPDALKFYYWFYPHRRQVFVRDAVLGELGKTGPIAFWLLKFFPLAFMVTINADAEPAMPHSLNFHRALSTDAEHDVPLRLRPPLHALWPEHPTGNAMILYGQGAHIAESMQRIRR